MRCGSRHPNYYGDWLVWIGITLACSSIVLTSDARASLVMGPMTALVVSTICPWFLYKMFRHVSIPVIENKYDALYMKRSDYRKWRRISTLRFMIDSSSHWFWELDP
jgi:steroid 5-alpha reductase family enzyme